MANFRSKWLISANLDPRPENAALILCASTLVLSGKRRAILFRSSQTGQWYGTKGKTILRGGGTMSAPLEISTKRILLQFNVFSHNLILSKEQLNCNFESAVLCLQLYRCYYFFFLLTTEQVTTMLRASINCCLLRPTLYLSVETRGWENVGWEIPRRAPLPEAPGIFGRQRKEAKYLGTES
ncbi:hypothetical protein CEXT_36221 [Caerostris extrusa]|uniref:Uncharacterized protein n=1 Tax=Caerostris extrusa TaxID=172846 RepID=A0AAV4MEF3_CAEEX|nr:hypothetical protein CEXT_36221 [Caerostris extrusa]